MAGSVRRTNGQLTDAVAHWIMAVDTPHPDVRTRDRARHAFETPPGQPPVPRSSAIPVAPAIGSGLRRRLLTLAAIIAALGAAAYLAAAAARSDPTPATAASWDIEIASAGAHPVTAFVYGREAGLHLVRVPAASAPAAERRRVAARLGAGDVYLVSLGADPLTVETAAPAGAPPMRLGARSRFVTLSQKGGRTSVRTGWR